MALNLDATGKKSQPFVHTYRWQDVVLYALGIGAKTGELDYLYEGRGPKVFPTYAVVPTFYACAGLFDVIGGNLLGVVHGGQLSRVHKPFPSSGKLTTIGTVAGVYDLKRMAQANMTTETRDEKGDLICETEWSILYRMDGGFGGPPPPKRDEEKPPAREPDWTHEEATSPEQALLYRLSGDLNPLHADPKIGEMAGFGKPILHGLATYGFAARAVVQKVCGGDADKLKAFSGQFRKPVWPGDTLVTEGWNEGKRVVLRTSCKERPGEYVFSGAWAEVG